MRKFFTLVVVSFVALTVACGSSVQPDPNCTSGMRLVQQFSSDCVPANAAPQPTAAQPTAAAPAVPPAAAPAAALVNSSTGPYTLDKVIEMLVPNPDERPFVAVPRWQDDHYVIETAKTAKDADGHPCCGVKVTWTTNPGGIFDYWAGFAKPNGSNCTTVDLTDPTSQHHSWRNTCEVGSTAIFVSDGVSWYPPSR